MLRFQFKSPITNEDIDAVYQSLPKSGSIVINGVKAKRNSDGYLYSRTTNALVRLVIMMVNGRIYPDDETLGYILPNAKEYIGSYQFVEQDRPTDIFTRLTSEQPYRVSEIQSVADYMYLCAITQLYAENIRQT